MYTFAKQWVFWPVSLSRWVLQLIWWHRVGLTIAFMIGSTWVAAWYGAIDSARHRDYFPPLCREDLPLANRANWAEQIAAVLVGPSEETQASGSLDNGTYQQH